MGYTEETCKWGGSTVHAYAYIRGQGMSRIAHLARAADLTITSDDYRAGQTISLRKMNKKVKVKVKIKIKVIPG